jgi:predicted DNA-binding helix-hairpin-helix protein
LLHREQFPVNLNTAPREMLLRVPGLGVKSVDKLIQVRRYRRIRHEDLKSLRVPTAKVLPFVEVANYQPGRALTDQQLARQLAEKPGPSLVGNFAQESYQQPVQIFQQMPLFAASP